MAEGFAAARSAGILFPFSERHRKASAYFAVAIAHGDRYSVEGAVFAIVEIENALKTDPNAADLLAYLTSFKLLRGDDDGARIAYKRFQQVARGSSLATRYGTSPTAATEQRSGAQP